MARRSTRQTHPRTNGQALGSAVNRIERELGSLQKQLRSQGRSLEKRIAKGRRELASRGRKLETRSRKQVRSLLTDVRRSAAYKRARSLARDAEKRLDGVRKDAGKRLGSTLEDVLGTLQVATRSDLRRVDRKLRKLDRKLDELEKTRRSRSSSDRPSAHA